MKINLLAIRQNQNFASEVGQIVFLKNLLILVMFSKSTDVDNNFFSSRN